MEGFLNRYRNITVLFLVIFAQILLLAVQVKNDQDVRMIRVWTVTAVTPVARILEGFRGGSIGFIRNYIVLHDADSENRRLREEVGRLKIENTFLKNEVSRADRAQALQVFQAHTPSKMLAATIIAMGAGSNSKVVFVDRGSLSGVMRGMAVVTPDGIVGKVISAYPSASEVMLVTDPDFAAGVISQKSQSHGTLKGDGTPTCKVDYIPLEDKLEPGEMLFTSGDDRIFPRGFPVGVVKAVRPGQPFKEVLVQPAGIQHGLEDVLIIVSGVHQEIPEVASPNQPVYLAPPPAATAEGTPASTTPAPAAGTEADKLRAIYKSVGDAQNHNFGEGPPGTKPPDFTKLPSSPLPPGTVTPNAAGQRPPGGPTGATRPVPGPTGAATAPRPAPTGPTGGAIRPSPGPTGATVPRPQVPGPAPTGGVRPAPTGATLPRPQTPAAPPKSEPAKKAPANPGGAPPR